MKKIINDNKEFDASRLCTISDYQKLSGLAYNTVVARAFKGILETIRLGGVDFIILSEEEVSKKLEEVQ